MSDGRGSRDAAGELVRRGRSVVDTSRPERIVLGIGLLAGVGTILFGLAAGFIIFVRHGGQIPESSMEVDFLAYYAAGQAVWRGDPFIGYEVVDGTLVTDKAYVYPPITALVFVLFGFVPEWYVSFGLFAVVLLGAFYGTARILIQFIELQGQALDPTDRWLIVGYCLCSCPSVMGLLRGNIDPVILLLISGGFLAFFTDREVSGGILWAGAALFKLFPALLAVWLLHRRAYLGIASAVITGVGVMLVGVAVFGIDAHIDFFEFVLTERSRAGAFEGGLDPTRRWITLLRPLSQVLPVASTGLLVVAVLLVAPVVALTYRHVETALDSLVAFTATLVALLITIVPSTAGYVVYLIFPMIALLYLTEHRTTKRLYLSGFVLLNIPLYPHDLQRAVAELSLDIGVVDQITAVLLVVFSVGSIALWGCLLVLAGCVSHTRQSNSP